MSTPLSLAAVRRCVVLDLFCLLATPVLADSITIGSITFLSYGTWGDPHKAFANINLDTTGITYDAHFQGMEYSLLFEIHAFGWDAGWFTTLPPTDVLLDPPYFCPCESAVFTMSLLDPWPFRLANGKLFTPVTNFTITMEPLPGQTFLQPGQTAAIVLTSVPSPVPEPASLVLLGSGLLGVAAAAWRKRQPGSPHS